MTTKVPQVAGGLQSGLAASTTYYLAAANGASGSNETVEANAQLTYRTAGVLSNAAIRITANNRGAGTLKSRINGADGAQSVSVTASTTGYFEDASNTDTIAAGDEVCLAFNTGSGGSLLAISLVSTHFAATTNTVLKMCARATVTGVAFTTASATRYMRVAGQLDLNATEAQQQTELNVAGTLKDFQVTISANARTTTTTFRTRKNGANGNGLISVGAGVTGIVEDTSNTDTVAVNDLVNYSMTTAAADSNSITVHQVGAEFESTAGAWPQCAGTTSTLGTSATHVFPIGGWAPGTNALAMAATMRSAFTLSNFWINITSNARDGGSTYEVRLNGSASALSIAVGAGVSGTFEDTDTVAVASGDTLDVACTLTGTSGNIVLRDYSTSMTAPAASPPPPRRALIGALLQL